MLPEGGPFSVPGAVIAGALPFPGIEFGADMDIGLGWMAAGGVAVAEKTILSGPGAGIGCGTAISATIWAQRPDCGMLVQAVMVVCVTVRIRYAGCARCCLRGIRPQISLGRIFVDAAPSLACDDPRS